MDRLRMISVADAQAALQSLVAPLGQETVILRQAAGRVLAAPVTAVRNQPPFSASAMDGYAVAAKPVPKAGDQWNVIGESAAGHGFDGTVSDHQAVRIFTGAPLPEGSGHVIIQEDVDRIGNAITLRTEHDTKSYVRPAGADFKAGDVVTGPLYITPFHVALFAAMNAPQIDVMRKPIVAIIGTGDELCQPGEAPGPDQIIASNTYGLAALIEHAGAIARMLPVAKDRPSSLIEAFRTAAGADLIVTIGGASVGDHDLVGQTATSLGLNQTFYKVAMRPGKPLMAGTLNGVPMVGLPGNPVSAMVCGHVFILPMIERMLGFENSVLAPATAPLSIDISANGPRAHYMRAVMDADGIRPFDRQDSALLSVLTRANVLLIREPNAPPLKAGAKVEYLKL